MSLEFIAAGYFSRVYRDPKNGKVVKDVGDDITRFYYQQINTYGWVPGLPAVQHQKGNFYTMPYYDALDLPPEKQSAWCRSINNYWQSIPDQAKIAPLEVFETQVQTIDRLLADWINPEALAILRQIAQKINDRFKGWIPDLDPELGAGNLLFDSAYQVAVFNDPFAMIGY
mgnify:CR=1 FL=1